MASQQKHVEPQHIELIHLNKYVGYLSDHLSVQMDKTVARVTHLHKLAGSNQIKKEKFKIVIDRFQGKVSIHNYYADIESNSQMREQFEGIQLVHCRKAVLTLRASDQIPAEVDGVRANRFHRKEESKTSSDKQGNSLERMLRTEKGQYYQNAITPGFHYLALILEIKSNHNDLFLLAKRREERDILLHELNNICTKSNEEVELFSARGEVMHKIDPIASFNAWNLSIACGPDSRHLEDFHTTGLKALNSSVAEQAHIIKAEAGFVCYIRDGVRCFVSATLRKEMYVTDGDLWKESATQIVSIKGKYRPLFLSINFTKNLVETRSTRSDDSQDKKSTPFSAILEVSRLELDIFKGEHKQPSQTKEFRSKFMVKTLKRTYFFFAKSETEREVWIESFTKVIEANVAGQANFNLKSRAEGYLESLVPEANDSVKHLGTQMRQKRTTVEGGVDLYMSEHLEVTKNGFKGDIMKAVENVGVFNYDKYHTRFFMLEFGQPYCYFYEKKISLSFQRSHKQRDILQCHVINDSDLQQRLDERNEKRTSSWVRKVITTSISRCPWNFPFLLKFSDKEYELNAPTRHDREQWVYLFSTIAKMNKAGVKSEILTPFEWLREKEMKKQKAEAELKMTQSARNRATEEEVEKLLFEQVHLWLRMNQGTMQQHRTVVKNYESEHMNMTKDGARGSCYLISHQANNPMSHESKRGVYRLTSIQMHINSRIQTFLVQKVGVNGISKYTFNEVTSVETDDLVISKSDFDTSQADEAFKHCFKIQVKNNPKKLVSCSSENDRNHWIRCFSLIIQMKQLGIDAGKVNMFSFEQFRQYQLKLAFQSQNLTVNSTCISPSVMPLDAQELSATLNQSMNIGGLQRPGTQQSVRNSTAALQRLGSAQRIEEEIQDCETATFAMSYRFIEGYLLKEVNSKRIFGQTARHIRYFRIVFATGKFNIKTCKDQNQMRSFELRELRSATVLGDPDMHENVGSIAAQLLGDKMTTHKKTKQLFNVNEYSERPNWPFTFSIDFSERRFDLAARTKFEMHQWLRVFNLIVTLNKIGYSVTEKNPYTFEAQQNIMKGGGNQAATSGRQTMQASQTMNMMALETLNNTQPINNSQHVDYGIVKSPAMNAATRESDSDVDNVNTANLALNGDQQNQSVFINSINTRDEFTQNMAQNLTQLRNMQIPSTYNRSNDMQQEQPSGQQRQGRFKQSAREVPPFYNHNITVQNITINQMTMMQNYGQNQLQQVQAEAPVRASSVEHIVVSGEIQADLERQAEIIQRPISQLNQRSKKKKKKKKVSKPGDNENANTIEEESSSRAYFTNNPRHLNQTVDSDCNSQVMIGGVKEVDDVAYRTDAIQSFNNAPLVDSMMRAKQHKIKVIENDLGEQYQDIEAFVNKPGSRKKKLSANNMQQESGAYASAAVINFSKDSFSSSTSHNNFFSAANNESKSVAEIELKPSNTIDRVVDFEDDLVVMPVESRSTVEISRQKNRRKIVEDFDDNVNESQPNQTTAIEDFHVEYSDTKPSAVQELKNLGESSSGLRKSRQNLTADGEKFISLSKVTLAGSSQSRIDDRLMNKIKKKNQRTLNVFENNQASRTEEVSSFCSGGNSKNVSMERIKQIAMRSAGDNATPSQSSTKIINSGNEMASSSMLKKGQKKKKVRMNRKMLLNAPLLDDIVVETAPTLAQDQVSWIPDNDVDDYAQQASATDMMNNEGVKRIVKSNRPFATAEAKPEEQKRGTHGDCMLLSDWD